MTPENKKFTKNSPKNSSKNSSKNLSHKFTKNFSRNSGPKPTGNTRSIDNSSPSDHRKSAVPPQKNTPKNPRQTLQKKPVRTRHHDLVIIGGGAAGMLSALHAHAAAPDLDIVILERGMRPGRKLLATGNGRCNIANRNAEKSHYFTAAGNSPDFVCPAFNAYPVEHILAKFADMGLITKEEDNGKYYPLGDQAAAVLDTLRLYCAASGIPILTQCTVTDIAPGFYLTADIIENTDMIQNPDNTKTPENPGKKDAENPENNTAITQSTQIAQITQLDIHAKAVILAMGGIASPQLGTSDGFAPMLSRLNHKTTLLYPALTQIKTADKLPNSLQGIKFKGTVTLPQEILPDKKIPLTEFMTTSLARAITESGEVLFTSTGISGPPVFQLSREVSRRCQKGETPILLLDMLPAIPLAPLTAELRNRRKLPFTLSDVLSGLLNKRLGQVLIRHSTLHRMDAPAHILSEADITAIAANIKALPLVAASVADWPSAQVMAGGLELTDFDSQTLQSNHHPGLFAAGEILDICGDCGGYNLSWAWSSACLAADSAVNFLHKNS